MEGNTEFKEWPQRRPNQDIKDTAMPQTVELSWVNRLRKRLNGIFRKNKEGGSAEWPSDLQDVSIDIVFGRHLTASDVDNIKERFDGADVYIPEARGWNQDAVDILKYVSSGENRNLNEASLDKQLANLKSDPNWAEMLKMIHNSKKPIAFIDVPSSNPLYEEIKKGTSGLMIKYNNFPSVLDDFKQYSRRFMELERKREDYMVSQLPIRMRELLKEYPYLKEKKPIKVLLSLGSPHTAVYHSFKKQGEDVDVSRSFGPLPYIYGYNNEVRRRYGFGRKVSDELASKMFLETAFGMSELVPMTMREENDQELTVFLRRVFSRFSFEEAGEVFNRIKQGEGFRKIFEDKFEQKGIKIPQTAQDLNEFLAKPEQKRSSD